MVTKMANNIPGVVLSKPRNTGAFPAKENVIGVGIGFAYEAGHETGEVGIQVLVSESAAESDLAAKDLVPRTIDDILVDVQEVGVPRLLSTFNQAHGSVTGGLGDSGGGESGMACTVVTDNVGIPYPASWNQATPALRWS